MNDEKEKKTKASKPQLISSTRPYFAQMVESAVQSRKLSAPPATQSYIVDLLEHYLLAVNLHEKAETRTGTLAEMFLTANNAEPSVRTELLKKLGDTSLYISGFFGDSLNRKLVDIDYYAGIGGTAYGTLATVIPEETSASVFHDLGQRFLGYVEVLTYISQQAMIQTHGDLLRLYSRYLATGSKMAEQQLAEHGVLTLQPTGSLPTKQ